MKYIAIIPARGGSKGIPKKNIKLLGKKPLINYTLDSAQKCNLIDEIIVDSEDDEILQTAHTYLNNITCLKRPLQLAQDHTPTLDLLMHICTEKKYKTADAGALILLQCTYPFREAHLIKNAIEMYEKMNADCLISVLQIPHAFNPHWAFENNNGYLQIATGESELIPRRQELPAAYYRDGAIYIVSINYLLTHKKLVGGKIAYIETNEKYYVNIDTQNDWEIAENKLRELCVE